jgi:hypothetical protein
MQIKEGFCLAVLFARSVKISAGVARGPRRKSW